MIEKRILILSSYYEPDLSAGSFRATALVEALLEQASSKIKIVVITTLPNRYNSYDSHAKELESSGQLSIHRIKLPKHSGGMVDQSKAYIYYARAVSKLTNDEHYDLVYATSGRLMTAVLGAWIARRLGAPLYLDIRDIFVDTIKDVLPKKAAFLLKPLFSLLERWAINHAVHVNLVSLGFEGYFKSRYPKQSFSYFTNGIDEEFLQGNVKTAQRDVNKPVYVVYAGNMGEGQGLHAIVPSVANRLRGRAVFKLIGDGGRRQQLEKALAEAGTNNVELSAPISRKELIKEYLAADVLFLHLNDYDAFKKVLPSKIFEYAALGKPIWAGVSGYAAQFIHDEVKNAAVFCPCDTEQALKAFELLSICNTPREEFIHKFSRKHIMAAMAACVISYLEKNSLN